MSLTLLGIDLSDELLERGSSSASITDVVGILAQTRSYVIADNIGQFSPVHSAGLLFRNSWRNQVIKETEVNSRQTFTGSVKNVGLSLSAGGYRTKIKATEPMGTLLKFLVEENDITTHAGFTVSGAHAIGVQTITITAGATTIPAPSLVSFSTDLIPRYQIQTASGSPTTSITLDRGLEVALAGGETLRVSVATAKTVPGAISDALVAVGMGSEIGSTFSTLNASETTAARFIRMQIRKEDNVTLADHIGKLLTLGNMSLTVNVNGIIDIIANLAYDGRDIPDELSGGEIMEPWEINFDDQRLVIGYDCLYVSGETVQIASGDVDQTVVDQWAGVNRWQPLTPSASLVEGYKYLYIDAGTADYYGAQHLDFWGTPRVRLTCSMKQSYHDNPLHRISVQLGKEFALNMPIAANQTWTDEPVRVVGFTYNEEKEMFSQMVLELLNFPSPNVPRAVVEPVLPVVVAEFNINEGVTTVFEPTLVGELFIQVFLADQVTSIATTQVNFNTQGDGDFYAIYQSSILNNGQTYYVKYFTRVGTSQSEKTGFIQIIPVDTKALWGQVSWNTGTWSA